MIEAGLNTVLSLVEDLPEERLHGVGRAQPKHNPSDTDADQGYNFDELGSNRVALGSLQHPAAEPRAPKRAQQDGPER